MTSPSWTSQSATLGSHFPSQVKWTSRTTWSLSPLRIYVLWVLLHVSTLVWGAAEFSISMVTLLWLDTTPNCIFHSQSCLTSMAQPSPAVDQDPLPPWPAQSSGCTSLIRGLGTSAPPALSQLCLLFHSTHSSSLILSISTAPSIL